MKHLMSLLWLFMVTSFLFASTNVEYEGCDSFSASVTSTACNNCYAQGGPATQYSYMVTKYRLYKKSGSTWNYLYERYNGTTTYTFTGLSAGTYRVEGFHSEQTDGICYPAYNISGQQVGCLGTWYSDGNSAEIEIGTPNPVYSLYDTYGTVGNNIFCVGNPVYLDGSGSTGERFHWVAICKQNPSSPGNCLQWNTTDWVDGKAGVINLLTEVWQNGQPSWTFDPGVYEIQFALSQLPCSSWEVVNGTFTVVNSGCRLAAPKELTISLSPNPTQGQIRIDGLEKAEGDIQYLIYDTAGKLVRKDYVQTPNQPIDIQDLSNGMYVMQLITNKERIARKFTVAK